MESVPGLITLSLRRERRRRHAAADERANMASGLHVNVQSEPSVTRLLLCSLEENCYYPIWPDFQVTQ